MDDEPTDLDQITDHPFKPATFRDAWPGICGYLVDGLPCGFTRAEHADPGEEESAQGEGGP
jgi:hypothetical protein